LEIAAAALDALLETTELLPFMIRIDLYGGIYSVYDSRWPLYTGLIKGLLEFRDFAKVAHMLLVSYKSYCQNLKRCIRENPLLQHKILDSVSGFAAKILIRYPNLVVAH
jgi:hypothetical protein